VRRFVLVLLCILVMQSFVCSVQAQSSTVPLYQVSTITALKQGKYNGSVSFGELKKRGDFGIGTLNGLNGEMVAIDGQFFQIRTDGKAYTIEDSAKSPFALVLFFRHATTFQVGSGLSMKALEQALDKQLPSLHRIWAIRVTGTFPILTVRSVPIQHEPYPTLKKALEEQVVFRLDNSTGALVGFRFPHYMEGVNVAGYHFHYVDKDHQRGGHVLDFTSESPQVEAVKVSEMEVRFLDH
jgi:acetolactate decarboxylase